MEQTRRIANVCIHVERVIGSVRQKYSILSGNVPTVDKIVCICCALVNL